MTMNGGCWLRDLLTWSAIAHHSATAAGAPNRCRVGVGVPFSRGAASGGQISAQAAVQKLEGALAAFPAPLAASFGGMFGWDEYWDHRENGPAGSYARELAELLSAPSFVARVDGASGAGRVCEVFDGASASAAASSAAAAAAAAAASPTLPPPAPGPFYARDYTQGGGIVLDPVSGAEVYTPYCACARVATHTAFTAASSCLEHWAAQPSGACQRPPTGAATGGGRTPPEPAPNASDAQVEHFTSVLASEPPPRLAITIETVGVAAGCDELSALDASLRAALCTLLEQAYAALGYSTAGLCAKAQAELVFDETDGAAGDSTGAGAGAEEGGGTCSLQASTAIPPPAGVDAVEVVASDGAGGARRRRLSSSGTAAEVSVDAIRVALQVAPGLDHPTSGSAVAQVIRAEGLTLTPIRTRTRTRTLS